MVAKDKGLDLKFVANGASTTGEIGKDIGGVVVTGRVEHPVRRRTSPARPSR